MDQYEKLGILGRGSYGVALLARPKGSKAPSHGDDASLLVIKETDLSQLTPAKRKETQNEADVLRSLSHVNVISYIATFLDSGKLYIVMEYADGGDLEAAIKRRKQAGGGGYFSERRVLSIFGQCTLGLQHTHARHILHRDLKSQNIFLMATGHVKLGDFGIARVLDATKDYAKTMVGTPYYLSPEIIADRPYNLKSDVWSLGVVLYEMATLKHPFSADALVDLASKILKDQCPPISDEYSQDLAALIRSMLSKDAKPRPSVGEILSLPFLQEAMHGANERYSLGLDLSPYAPVRVEPEAPSPNGASRAEAGLEEGQEEEDDYEEEDFEDYSEDGSEDGAEKAPQTEAQLELQESVAALKLAAGSAASVAAPGAGGQGGGQGVREKADSLRAYLRGQAPSFEDGYRLLRGAGDAPDAEDLRQEFSGLVGADKAPQLFPLFQLLCFLEDVSADAPEAA